MKNLETIKFIFEILAIVIAFLGLAYAYFDGKNERREAAYRKLGDSYNDILKVCMSDYQLDCYDIPSDTIYTLTEEQVHQQTIIYTMLINHFEQAYSLIKKNKDVWPGWELYFRNYFVRKRFLEVWINFQDEWSENFRTYINQKIIQPMINDGLVKEKYRTQLSGLAK